MNRPRFSIIIPTRNRARLLPCAIRSALAQTFDDYELVVINNASTDGTAAAVEAFSDPRLRIVHSAESRLMHDNWAFALGHARGQFVLYLCDDDAWHPRLLEIVDGCIANTNAEVVCWRSLTHFSNDWFEPHRRGLVSLGPPFTDRAFDIDAAALLDSAFDMRITITDIVPRMLNSAVSAELIERLERAGLRLFRPCNPDYSCFIAMALHARRMTYLDAPLLVSGATPQSVGASASQRGAAAQKFLDDLFAREPDLILPPPPRTPSVWVGQTYLQCAMEIPVLQKRDLNWTHLYGIAAQEIERYAGGSDVSDWRIELNELLSDPLANLRKEIESFVSGKRSVETDRFLIAGDDGAVLGLGPHLCADSIASHLGAETIDDVAMYLDDWISRQGCSLANLWDEVAARCAHRQCVIVGLGLNGRAILRMPPLKNHPLHGRLRSHDDRSDLAPVAAPRMDGFQSLDPRAHFVLITPNENPSLVDRLAQRGFSPEADMCALASLGASLSARESLTAGAAGIPSDCT